MRIFIGQPVTGEDKEKITLESRKIESILNEKGHEVYCTMFEDRDNFESKSKKEIMGHAFSELDKSEVFFVILRNEKRSEGLLMEVGYVLGKNKKIILCINEEVNNTYLRDLADQVVEFESIDDLYNKLKEVDL